MKKVLVFVLAAFVALGFSTNSFAQGKKGSAHKAAAAANIIHGKIVSVDAASNTIVVKDDATGSDRTVSVSAEAASSLKAGEKVRVKNKASGPAEVHVVKGKKR